MRTPGPTGASGTGRPCAWRPQRRTAPACGPRSGGGGPTEIRARITKEFEYDLSRSVDEIRPGYRFDVTCQGTVPEAITCALESESFEDAVRNAVSLGGDSDTLAAIAGPIAEAMHGLPEDMIAEAKTRYLSEAPDIVRVMERMREAACG